MNDQNYVERTPEMTAVVDETATELMHTLGRLTFARDLSVGDACSAMAVAFARVIGAVTPPGEWYERMADLVKLMEPIAAKSYTDWEMYELTRSIEEEDAA